MNRKKPETVPVKKRIIIVDDHPIMREGLAQLIRNEPDLEMCGEADNAHTGLELVIQLKPDLVIADITLPGKSGLELVKDIQAARPGTPVLVISMHDESLYAGRVLRAGGRGYIMKQEGGKKMMQAIRRIFSGQIYVSERISANILEIFSGGKTEGAASPVEQLTDREFEVFELIGRGTQIPVIAKQLHISVKTAETHRTNIKQKLNAKTVAELIRHAVRWVEAQNPG